MATKTWPKTYTETAFHWKALKQRRASLPEKEKDDKDGKEKDKEKKEEKKDKEKVEKEKDKENHKKVGSFRPRFTPANYPLVN